MKNLDSNLLIFAGPVRTGTTTLFSYFNKNKRIGQSISAKELFFFDKHFSRGKQWFESCFEIDKGISFYFDYSPSIFANPQAIERCYEMYPNAKIVVIRRDPVERSISHIKLVSSYGFDISDPEALIERFPGIIESSSYNQILDMWQPYTDPGQLLEIEFSDIQNDASKVLEQIGGFCELDLSSDIKNFPKENSKNHVRYPLIARLVYCCKLLFNKIRAEKLFSYLAKVSLLKKIVFADKKNLTLSAELEEKYKKLINEYLHAVGEL